MPSSPKTVLITGATNGFGRYIAAYLAQQDYKIIVFGRSIEKLTELQVFLKEENAQVEFQPVLCDLSSFASIASACEEVKAQHFHIDILVLNAGIWNFKERITLDGIEETFQVNLLAPILIFQELFERLPKSADAKVIFTSSALHFGKIDIGAIEKPSQYSGFHAYRQSKLGILLLTRLLAMLPEYKPMSFYAVHPGVISTGLARDGNFMAQWFFRTFGQSEFKGALTHNFLIDEPAEKLQSGAYYTRKQIKKTTKYTYDLVVAEQLWNKILDQGLRYFQKKNKNQERSSY